MTETNQKTHQKGVFLLTYLAILLYNNGGFDLQMIYNSKKEKEAFACAKAAVSENE